MRKYRNTPVEVDGIKFASKKEATRYGELKLMERAGLIQFLRCHPSYDLKVNGHKIGIYTADFTYQERVGATVGAWSQWIVEDVKSPATAKAKEFKRTLKLMNAIHGIDVKVVL